MRTVALICAAGSQERWERSGGKGRKQLIEIDGEPIIRRLYRLARRHTDEVITLVRNPDAPCWDGLNPRRPDHEGWMADLGKFLDGRPYWPQEGRVVVLYGDAYYSEATVERIFTHQPDQPTVYGRAQEGRSESFGFAFRVPDDVEEVERVCRSVCRHPHLVKRGGPWRFFWHRHTGSTTYDRVRLTALATEENGWVEVGHDETDDFDRFSDLQTWRERHRANERTPMIEITAKRAYRGHDPQTGRELVLGPSQRARVSEAKAAQLRRDFPDQFEFGEPAEKAPAPQAPKPKAKAKRTTTRTSTRRSSTRRKAASKR